MRYFYIAVQVKENNKYYAYVLKVSENDNLICRLAGVQNIYTANIFPTKKRAVEVVTFWNEGHKANNRYLFDETF